MGKSKTLAIAVPLMILLSGLFIYKYGYLQIHSNLGSIREGQAVKTRTLGKYITLISEKPQIEKQLASLKEARNAESSKLIEGQTLSLAAATLQDIIKGIITGRGGTISSERVGKPEDFRSFKAMNVSIDAVIPDTRALADILYSIETRTPYLVVKELDVRPRDIRNPRELMIKLDVSAMTTAK